jgi:predicted GNAT family acetyltransferase
VPKEKEFAPGIPLSRAIQKIPTKKKPETWEFGIHRHLAERAGEHFDLRLGDPQTGRAHSWALRYLPKPGETRLAIQQPTHTVAYMDFKGRLESDYGKGEVELARRDKAEILRANDKEIRFNVYPGKDVEEYALRRRKDNQWLIQNITTSRQTGPGKLLPSSKPSYKVKQPDRLQPDDPNTVLQAKIDGAHVLYQFKQPGQMPRVVSYRPTERATGLIEHTHKLPDFQAHKTPAGLKDTILRGELYAVDEAGKALPAARVGGILNAGVWKSRDKQQTEGHLVPVAFDIVRYKGKNVENEPYAVKKRLLEAVYKIAPWLQKPRTAETPKEKAKLIEDIRTGKEPSTEEGVVEWRQDKPVPAKAKFLEERDVYVRNIFAEEGAKRKGTMAGGFEYSITPKGPIIGRVGTGLSHEMKKDMLENPSKYEGLKARVMTQRAPAHYAPRAPAFHSFHLDQDLPEGVKTAAPRVMPLVTQNQKSEGLALEKQVFGTYPPTRGRKDKMFGIVRDGKVVAVTRVNEDPLRRWKTDRVGYRTLAKLQPAAAISAMAVSPEYREKGMATALHEHLQKEYPSLLVGTGSKSNKPAMTKIQSNLGFRDVLQRKNSTQAFWEKTSGADITAGELLAFGAEISGIVLPLTAAYRFRKADVTPHEKKISKKLQEISTVPILTSDKLKPAQSVFVYEKKGLEKHKKALTALDIAIPKGAKKAILTSTQADPAILAHELGHSERTDKLVQKLHPASILATSLSPSVPYLLRHAPKWVQAGSYGVPFATATPSLIEEYKASKRALELLKEQGATSEELKRAKSKMIHAYSTYAVLPMTSAALGYQLAHKLPLLKKASASATLRRHESGGIAIEKLHVPPEERGKGKARELLSQIKDKYKGASLWIRPRPFGDMPVSIDQLKSFYESEGFRTVDGRDNMLLKTAQHQGWWKGDPMSPDGVKFKTDFQGIPVHVDRPKGFVMMGKDATGKPWARKYQFDYGFIPRTKGGDGEGLDVFLGPNKNAPEAFWAVQSKPDGSFDEYKVFLGFADKASALAAYKAHIPGKLLKGMASMRVEIMKAMMGIEPEGVTKISMAPLLVGFYTELKNIE